MKTVLQLFRVSLVVAVVVAVVAVAVSQSSQSQSRSVARRRSRRSNRQCNPQPVRIGLHLAQLDLRTQPNDLAQLEAAAASPEHALCIAHELLRANRKKRNAPQTRLAEPPRPTASHCLIPQAHTDTGRGLVLDGVVHMVLLVDRRPCIPRGCRAMMRTCVQSRMGSGWHSVFEGGGASGCALARGIQYLRSIQIHQQSSLRPRNNWGVIELV
ncbi:hypothetical protein C8F01DRAFT_506820 [Mycena amicta]|nr:hypothetical protein C8F01DRAFT_506820 [Mycena amicta]